MIAHHKNLSLLFCCLTCCFLTNCTPTKTYTNAELIASDANGLTLLHKAARDGQTSVLKDLLAQGADINSRDNYGRTAIHWAAINDERKAASILIEHGANVSAISMYDMTPLHWAALMGHRKMISLLLTSGANVNARNFYGMTPLHLTGNAAVARTLIAAGALIETRDRFGMTPLHWAFSIGEAQALLDAGANIFARAQDGRQPITMTVSGNEKLAMLLIYPQRDRIRLRGENTTLNLTLRSVTYKAIKNIQIQVHTDGLIASANPALLYILHPAQISNVHLTFTRQPQKPINANKVIIKVVDETKLELATITLPIDTRDFETPEDRGLLPVTTVKVRPAPAIIQYLAYAAVPLFLLIIWFGHRYLTKRRKKLSSRRA
ncbi:MAG: ankyrin repeat domain-containing protein [Deltaproteobacteria bacterium]|nr:ankyrin repeat domain-containing protein [Deltaproteobacteria bacterium]